MTSRTYSTDASLMLDMRRCRIRIHKRTIHALGDPEYLVLIINPEELSLCVKCSIREDRMAHKVDESIMHSKVCYELNSTSLIRALNMVCPELQMGSSYKLEGRIMQEQQMAQFYLRNAELNNRRIVRNERIISAEHKAGI